MNSKGLYKGQIYQNVQTLDVADLDVVSFIDGVDPTYITKEEVTLGNDLVNAIQNSATNLTFNDNRLCLIATKLTRNVPAGQADISYYILSLQYFKAFYTNQNQSVNSLISFLTTFLEYSIGQKPMPNDVLVKYKQDAENVLNSNIDNQLLLPLYVIESLQDASKLDDGTIVVVNGANDIPQAPPVVVVDQGNGNIGVETKTISTEDEETINEYLETIKTLDELIDIGVDEDTLNEYNATKDTLNELIAMIRQDQPQMARGGQINTRKLAMRYLSRN